MAFVNGKVALVTGAASGIGYAIAENLLKNGAKALAIVDYSQRNGEKACTTLKTTFGNKVIFIKADVTNTTELENAFKTTVDTFSNLDIVVNNAGIVDEINWETMLNINLGAVIRGSYLALRMYLPKYRSNKDDAVIVNIASILGINSVSALPVYTAAKHGVVGFGKSLSEESNLDDYRIRVITICPGTVITPLATALDNKSDKVPRIIKELDEICEKFSTTEYIGKSVVEIMNKAQNGSTWVLEDENTPYKVEFPHRMALRKK